MIPLFHVQNTILLDYAAKMLCFIRVGYVICIKSGSLSHVFSNHHIFKVCGPRPSSLYC